MNKLNTFIHRLENAGLPREAWELADLLWLSRFLTDTATPDEGVTPEPVVPEEQPKTPPEPRPNTGATHKTPQPATTQATTLHTHAPARPEAAEPAPETATRPFRAYAPVMIPDPLALSRALRVLRRRVPSRTRYVLDETATTHNFAHLELPLPALVGTPERWLELALVVDDHDSKILWEPFYQELHRLLQRHGAFRDVRLWRLARDHRERICLRPGLHGGQSTYDGKVLRDPTGRRVVLVASDFTAPAWYRGDYFDLLRDWARRQPTALLHLLPQRLWRRTALGNGRFVALTGCGRPVNPALHPDSLRGETVQAWQAGLKLPVVTATPGSLSVWAGLLSGQGAVKQPGVVLGRPSLPHPVAAAEEEGDIRLRRFLAGASPQARQLAEYCAPFPLTLPVARLIQETFLPATGPAELAELFLNGILKVADEQLSSPLVGEGQGGGAMNVIYDFHPGIRQRLLNRQSPEELWHLLKKVSQTVENRLGRPHEFLARLADPTVLEPEALPAIDSRPFAYIRVQVLRRLGGIYGEWAARLEQVLEAGGEDEVGLEAEGGDSEGAGERAFIEPEMVDIPAGSFNMGDEIDGPVHRVTLSKFAVGKYPVTFEEYDRFCEASGRKKPDDRGPGWERGRGNRPVIFVSWGDAKAYCQWLSAQTGKNYTLLTEAQWEYACRTGSEYVYGKVWEWVQDWYGEYSAKHQTNPIGPESGSARVCRGGASINYGRDRRSAYRSYALPSLCVSHLGFRLARTDPLHSYTYESGQTDAPEPKPQGDLCDVMPDGSPGPELVWLPGGTFRMGSETGQDREKPVHDVTLDAFSLGRYPVTVGDFRRFVEATGYKTEAERGDGAFVYDSKWGKKKDANWHNPYLEQEDTHPVVCISWNDAQAYCKWLSEQSGEIYTLLSEAQWEYACRAGSEGAYCFGDDEKQLGAYAWYGKDYRKGSTHPVGQKQANTWGLQDMHGNVWEWVQDWYGKYSGEAQSNPIGPTKGSVRLCRGGSWYYVAVICRSAYRYHYGPAERYHFLGFRLARLGKPVHFYTLTLEEFRSRKQSEKHPLDAKQALFVDDEMDRFLLNARQPKQLLKLFINEENEKDPPPFYRQFEKKNKW